MARSLNNRNNPARHIEERPVRPPDVEPIDPHREMVDTAIIMAVSGSPGFPTINVLGAVLKSIGNESVTLAHVEERLEALSERGDITRLQASDGNGLENEFTYYPKDWKFKTTPQTQFIGAYKTPKALQKILSPEHKKLVNAISDMIDFCSDTVRLHIISQYCERCGARKEGHYCNE